MIINFPVLYPDELLYSAIARYHIRSGNISLKSTLDDLYNSKTITAVVELPANMDVLIKNMPVNSTHTSDELIKNHTMFPFYSAFLPQDRKEIILNSMKDSKGGDIYNRIGIMATTIMSNKYFKFCSECIKEDYFKYGETYWHRIHQIPGISLCSKHIIHLSDSNVHIHSDNKHEYIYASEENCLFELINGVSKQTALESREMLNKLNNVMNFEEYYNKLCILIGNVELLLNRQYNSRPSMWFRENYINKLIELELANVNGQVRQQDLINSFNSFYGKDLLYILQSSVNADDESNWLSQIVRKHRKTFQPLRHLLMIQFLGITLDDLFVKKVENKSFGEAPWPCLNAGAEHYRQLTINDLKITYDCKSKKNVGTFSCSCGFAYSRSGPDVDINDRYRIGRVKCFGAVWEEKLKSFVHQECLSLNEIARNLKVDPKTIDKYAEKLGLCLYWRKNNNEKRHILHDCKSDLSDFNERKEKYREVWLELNSKYTDKSKTALRNINNKAYIWLYRNDKEWLDYNTQEVPKCGIINSKVDWEKRDREILNEAKNVTEQLFKSNGKPERVTIGRVGKKIGKLYLLEKHLDKMPLTKEYLVKYTETVEDFQKRRIKWAINNFERDGVEVKEWRVMRKAGIKNLSNNEIKLYLDVLINK